MKSNTDLWANFLYNEKLDALLMDEEWTMELVRLCEALASKRGPLIRPYKARLESRKYVVETAFDLGIDLTAIKNKKTGKMLIGRGLLDTWNKWYIVRFGSNLGTLAEREALRRDIKTRLCKEKKNNNDL